MAKYDDTQSGLPTPPTSTASASTTLLDSTALPSPRYQGNPDIDDSTNASGTILRLRQQLANLTGQLAMERREHTDLQSACDGMARRCAGLLRGGRRVEGERRAEEVGYACQFGGRDDAVYWRWSTDKLGEAGPGTEIVQYLLLGAGMKASSD